MKIKLRTIDELILFEDENYIIINKPPFISSLDDRVDAVTIHDLAKKYDPGATLCHRLDKETSGVMVVARNPDAYRSMAIQLEKREVRKEYHALVEGLHDLNNEKIEASLLITSTGNVKIDKKDGKKSLTICNTIKAYSGYTLVSCLLKTGRMHQIRVHLASINAAIAGDITYGGKPFYLSSVKKNYHIGKYKEERPLIQRVALHSWSIQFNMPDGKSVEFSAPYPKDFKALINQLEKNK